MATFVLVHGAYHGAWCWARLIPFLEAAGHRAMAPDLPGHGTDPTPLAEISLATYTAGICQAVAAAETPVILVGHSMAGAVVAGVAEHMPARVDRLVFLSAYVPTDAQSVAQLVRADTQFSIPVQRADENGVPCLRLSSDVMRRHFYHDADEADFEWALSQAQIQPVAPFAGKAKITAANFGTVARAYIHCRYDRAIGLALQRQMAMTAECVPMVYLKSGHSPFVTQPQALSELLSGFSSGA